MHLVRVEDRPASLDSPRFARGLGRSLMRQPVFGRIDSRRRHGATEGGHA